MAEQGITVEVGIGAEAARRAHAGHIRRVQDGRPHVILKLAVSADGKAGLSGRRPAMITGEPVRRRVHLMRATSDDGHLILTGLLSGLSAEEIVALDWDQIDLDAGTIQVSGESARTLPLNDALRNLIAARRASQPEPAGTLLRSPSGSPLPLDDIRSLVMYAAYDAGLDGAEEVTPRIIRHTYLVYLLRQGIRFADIGRIVGRLPQEELAAYMRFAPSQPRLPLEQIDLVLPALRRPAV